MNYNKDKIKLRTNDEKQKSEWFKLFDELVEIILKRSKEEAENIVCDKSLYWIGHFFYTFEEQMQWVKTGIEFYKKVDNKPLYKYTIS